MSVLGLPGQSGLRTHFLFSREKKKRPDSSFPLPSKVRPLIAAFLPISHGGWGWRGLQPHSCLCPAWGWGGLSLHSCPTPAGGDPVGEGGGVSLPPPPQNIEHRPPLGRTCRPHVSNTRPVGQMWPARPVHVAVAPNLQL